MKQRFNFTKKAYLPMVLAKKLTYNRKKSIKKKTQIVY